MARRGTARRGGTRGAVRGATFPHFGAETTMMQSFENNSADGHIANVGQVFYGQPEANPGRYAEGYFGQLQQHQQQQQQPQHHHHHQQAAHQHHVIGVGGPENTISTVPTVNATNKPSGSMSWEKVRKMNSYRLRTLPLDMVHVLDEGRRRKLRVGALEGQQRKISALEGLENQEFIEKCLEPVDMTCDCCQVKFVGATKIQSMLKHIQSPQHATQLRERITADPLYAFKMNKLSVIPSTPQQPMSKKKVAKPPGQDLNATQVKRNTTNVVQPVEDGPQAGKKRKHADVPEEYRAMADWLACYVCNITCSSLAIYESHAIGKRHRRLLTLAPHHVQELPWGPYLIDGKPTIDTNLGAVKISVHGGRIGGDQPQLINSPWLGRIREFVGAKLKAKAEA